MTKHKIDDLFQQKLGDSEFSPSPAAWSKLESQLGQKKKKGIIFWMSMAASIALLLTFGWLIWRSGEGVLPTQTIAGNNVEQIENIISIDSVEVQNKSSSKTKELNVEEPVKSSEKKTIKTPLKKNTREPKNTQKQSVKKQKAPLIIIQQKSNLAQNNTSKKLQKDVVTKETENQTLLIESLQQDTKEVFATNIAAEKVEKPAKESGSIKIVYTLKPAISSESLAEQTTEKTKASPFRKAVALAKNMKENPKGIGSLREAKNNFLSFTKKKNGSK